MSWEDDRRDERPSNKLDLDLCYTDWQQLTANSDERPQLKHQRFHMYLATELMGRRWLDAFGYSKASA